MMSFFLSNVGCVKEQRCAHHLREEGDFLGSQEDPLDPEDRGPQPTLTALLQVPSGFAWLCSAGTPPFRALGIY